MPIRSLLRNYHSFGPQEIKVLAAAFEDAVRTLGLVDGDESARLMVAKRIIELAKQGELDPARLSEGVLKCSGAGAHSVNVHVQGFSVGRQNLGDCTLEDN